MNQPGQVSKNPLLKENKEKDFICSVVFFVFSSLVLFCFVLRLHMQGMEVPRLGVELEP